VCVWRKGGQGEVRKERQVYTCVADARILVSSCKSNVHHQPSMSTHRSGTPTDASKRKPPSVAVRAPFSRQNWS